MSEKREFYYQDDQSNKFWTIIGLFNWKKLGDDEAVIEPAIADSAIMGGPQRR